MSSDYSDLLRSFCDHSVDFIVVGAHALAAHGHIRATKDLDVWVRPTRSNAERAVRALEAFGAPLFDLTVEDLATPGVVFQIGVPPVRVDILTAVDGIDFDGAWADRVITRFDDVDIAVLSRRALIVNKRAAGRTQDLADIEWLEANPEE